MALPHTPELDKIKPFPTTATLASPISLPQAEKAMADQSQKVKGLPTPKTTPHSDVLIDSFKDSHLTDNSHAAQVSIERLRNGHDHTADFVPYWSPVAYPSPARLSEAEIRVADILANSHKEGTLPHQENPVPCPAAAEPFHARKRRLSQVDAVSSVWQYTTRLLKSTSYPHQQTQPISATVRTSSRKARLAAYHDGKAKSDKAIQARCGVRSSNGSRDTQTVDLTLGSKVSTDWINPRLNRQEGGKFIAALNNCTENLYRQRQSMEDAAVRVVTCGNTRWNRWNVPVSELKREVKRWEAGQLAIREISKPKSRLTAKSFKKPPPALAESVELTRSQTTRRRYAQLEDSSFDMISVVSQEQSEYVDEHPAKKTKTTVGRPERSPKGPYDAYDGSLPGEMKTTSSKRKASGEQQGKKSNNTPKRSKPSKKGNAESGGPRRGNGEGKAKNAKDKRLGDIKYWLCSKTQKFYAPKRPGDPVTPDHKGDWQALHFVRLPDWGSRMDAADIDFDEKLGPKGEYHGGDPKDLHQREQQLARLNNLSYDQYRCQKRRIFAARAVFDQISKTEGHAPSWGRTQTQLVGSIDANKSSYLYSNFDRWGWFDTVRDKWDDYYLQNLVDDFQAYSRQPWTPPSAG